jgi:eukaryotic-like serine/threonine-protein kinase
MIEVRGGLRLPRLCAHCGKSFSDATTFCTEDGTPLIAGADAMANTMLPDRMPTAAGGAGTAPNMANPDMTGATLAPVILPGPRTAEGGPATAVNSGPSPVQLAHAHTTAPNVAPAFVEPTMVELNPGTTVGEYVVESQIGEGGMGVIFSARHPIIGKRVAIKVLNPDMAANVAIVQRFIQEARSVNQIGHRNIVDIFSFGRLGDGRHYFVMEFLEGVPFSRRIQEPMEWTEALGIWLQVCSAVEAAHARGIVHRDLKPDNIFITPGGDGPFVKVLDFGIAKLTGNDTGVAKTSTGVPMGTPLYMSPEQTRGGAVDHRTDLYALGCILYETICGETPFAAPTFFEVMSKQLSEAPPPFGDRASVDKGLSDLVFKLLEKEPEDRTQTVAELRDELIQLRDLAMKSGQSLFERGTGFEASSSASGRVRPAKATFADESTERQKVSDVRAKKKPPIADGGDTVPEPRESQEMPAVPRPAHATTGVTAPAAPAAPSRMPMVIGSVGVLLALAIGGYLVFGNKPTPPVVVNSPPVVNTPPPVTPPPVATKGSVKVICTESGLTLSLDGEKVAEGGPVLQVQAQPGRHEIKVTRPGFLTWSNQVIVAAGETSDLVVRLEPEKPVKPASTGTPHKPKDKDKATTPTPTQPTGPRDKDATINPFGT